MALIKGRCGEIQVLKCKSQHLSFHKGRMGNDEGFPVSVCPHLGRTGLPIHRIREIEARQRGEAHATMECKTDQHIPLLVALPCPIGIRQTLLCNVGYVNMFILKSETLTNSFICHPISQISATTRRKPRGPK